MAELFPNQLMKKHINSLPNEALEMIFHHIEDKITLSKVCRRWDEVIDWTFGLPLEIRKENLEILSSCGVSSCIIQDECQYWDTHIGFIDLYPTTTTPSASSSSSDARNFIYAAGEKEKLKAAEECRKISWKYPHLVKEIQIQATLTKVNFEQILVSQRLRSLNKLKLAWVSVAKMDSDLIFKINKHHPQLKKLQIFDDDSYLQRPEQIQGNLFALMKPIHELYGNVLEFLKGFSSIESLKLQIPEPRAHKGFTRALFDFLEKSTRLKKLDLEFEDGVLVTTTPFIESWRFITLEQLEEQSLRLGKLLKITKLRLFYMGKRLQQISAWINLLTSLHGLKKVEIDITRRQHIPISVATSIVNNNLETIVAFRFFAGPRVGQVLDDYCGDFAIFKPCKRLQQLQLNFQDNVRDLLNITEDEFPPMLHHIELSNFTFCFEEIYGLVLSMKYVNSKLNLDEIWMEGEMEDSQGNSEDEFEYIEQIRTIAEKVLEMRTITCFTLGRLRKFPKLGIPIGPPGNMQILKASICQRIHLCGFRVVNPPQILSPSSESEILIVDVQDS